jgi:1-aminocyclopropane-1-carboxylate synthase
MRAIGLFALPSSLASQSLATILSHPTFLPTFLAQNRAKLIHHYNVCTRTLRQHKIPYIPSNAGFFIWIDLTHALQKMSGDSPLEKERALNLRMLDGGVHLATSEAFYGEEYGWFRITFTVEEKILVVGLKRLVQVLEADEVEGIEMGKLDLKN